MNTIFKKIISGFAAIAAPVLCFAQTDANSILNTATSTMKQAGAGVANVVSVLIGLVGIIMLGWNFAKRAKGDQQSNDALMNWGSALLISAIFLQIIKAVYF